MASYHEDICALMHSISEDFCIASCPADHSRSGPATTMDFFDHGAGLGHVCRDYLSSGWVSFAPDG